MAEAATFLGIPCITLTTSAEHPETWRTGTNELVGEDQAALAACMYKKKKGELKQGTLPERWEVWFAELNIKKLL